MAAINWGMLAKSQSDSETIEQAIARLILEHEQDEESHLGAGESLQSHKASEIIDHLAESIVADKIKDFNVEPQHLADFGNYYIFALAFEGLDFWEQIIDIGADLVAQVGTLWIYLQAATNNRSLIYAKGFNPPSNKEFIYRFQMSIDVLAGSMANTLALVGMGSSSSGAFFHGIYFKISGGDLYACYRVANGSTSTEYAYSLGVSFQNRTEYVFMIHYYPGEKIEFYIDEVLVYTATENLPTYTYSFTDPFRYDFTTLEDHDKNLFIRGPYFSQKK